MTTLALDMCEHIPYSASLTESTRAGRAAAFRAGPPVVSPAEAMRIERDERMINSARAAMHESIVDHGVEASLSAVTNLGLFLRLLPAEMPATDAYISANGSICFDWDGDPSCQLSILLKDKNQIAFAAYFSGEKVHGSTRFSSHELPEIMATVAKRWLRDRQG